MRLLRLTFVISGRVETAGRFRATPEGWSWSTKDGAVTLGDVTVLDAAREEAARP